MSALVISVVFLLAVAIGAALAKGVLALLLHLLIDEKPVTAASIKALSFFGALIAFWSLFAVRVESPIIATAIALVR